MVAVGDVVQLSGNTEPIFFPTNASFEDHLHVQLRPDLSYIERSILELKYGSAGYDFQSLYFHEPIDELFRQAVADVGASFRRAEIQKGKHRHSRLGGQTPTAPHPNRASGGAHAKDQNSDSNPPMFAQPFTIYLG